MAAAGTLPAEGRESPVRLLFALTPPGAAMTGLAALVERLCNAGLDCRAVPDLGSLRAALHGETPDAVLIDEDGARLDASGVLRARLSAAPGVSALIGVIAAPHPDATWLDAVDDFVLASAPVAELVTRVVRWRRMAGTQYPVWRRGPLTIDIEGHRAWWADREVQLSAREFTLLRVLAAHEGRVCPREALAGSICGAEGYTSLRFLEAHMSRLRAKLGPATSAIETVRGVGYRLRVDS